MLAQKKCTKACTEFRWLQTQKRRDFVNTVMDLCVLNSNNCSERMRTELRNYITVWKATFVEMCEHVMLKKYFQKEKL
jgi:hypothetical protein